MKGKKSEDSMDESLEGFTRHSTNSPILNLDQSDEETKGEKEKKSGHSVAKVVR